MTTVRHYDGDSAIVQWPNARMRERDSTTATMRQYDDDNATIRSFSFEPNVELEKTPK
ncbi:hypothetical protein DPMN_014778 [Dreissena polymorpha]|uniref:Uncharacterized protein n=1 Tax=Dreissena polymorpha TaxID=45954 RepID=A0A9D4NA13_DREPO|nr:hypothetical protein DPMN_014778 [Dreissena polymorpha]